MALSFIFKGDLMKREILVDPFGRQTIVYILDEDMYEINDVEEKEETALVEVKSEEQT